MNRLLVFVLGIMVIAGISSCLEEPTISPVARAYSVLRMGNLTSNLVALDIKVYTEINEIDLNVNNVRTISDLQQNTFSDFFDVYSGKRKVQAIDKNTGNVIFEKLIDAPAYTELSWYFSGYYHPDIDSTTFNFFSVQEGTTYLEGGRNIGQDSLLISCLHASGDTPSDSSKKLNVSAEYTVITTAGDTITDGAIFARELSFGGELVLHLRKGDYKFFFVNSTDTTDTLITYPSSPTEYFDANNKSYLFITGTPDNMTAIREDLAPLAARPK